MSTITAEFVAEARRSYVPAVAWAKANGWKKYAYSGSFGASVVFERHKDGAQIEVVEKFNPVSAIQRRSIVMTLPRLPEATLHPTSLPQAIDYLVTAGVLPVEFHSLSAEVENLRAVLDASHQINLRHLAA